MWRASTNEIRAGPELDGTRGAFRWRGRALAVDAADRLCRLCRAVSRPRPPHSHRARRASYLHPGATRWMVAAVQDSPCPVGVVDRLGRLIWYRRSRATDR